MAKVTELSVLLSLTASGSRLTTEMSTENSGEPPAENSGALPTLLQLQHTSKDSHSWKKNLKAEHAEVAFDQ